MLHLSTADLNQKLLYDSHVHFFGTGLSATEFLIDKKVTTLDIPSHLLDQKIIQGFGWSDNLDQTEFTTLCKAHPDKFFCLSYIDGHKSFVSHNLLKKLKFTVKQGEEIEAGFLISEVERDEFYKLLPKHNIENLEKMALKAQEIFKSFGVTKVRHLTGNENHWSCLKKLEQNKKLNIQIEVFFSEFMGQSLEEALKSYTKAKEESSALVSASGIKLFYDGSFGSETAYTSSSSSTLPRISKKELESKMLRILSDKDIPLAVHCIGDKALEDCLDIYSRLSQKSTQIARLHLEHAPVIPNSSLKMLAEQSLNCEFHFQPSHWIEDQHWYKKYKTELQPHKIYPFKELDKMGYTYHFGSDSPVVEPSKDNTLLGLKLIEESR